MDQNQIKSDRAMDAYLFAIIRRVLRQEPITAFALNREEFTKLMNLAQRQEVQSLAAYGLLLSGGLSSEQEAQCRRIVYRTMVYQQRWSQTLFQTCDLLEKAGICYLPLKGAVIRDLYPESWLRTSGDIDILVKDVDRAVDVLTENGYIRKRVGSHDVALTSSGGIPIEMHFQLMETEFWVNALLEQVWNWSVQQEISCCYRMDPEMLYFYHIAHMAKHMLIGGCGIRYFVDLWLLNQQFPLDEEKKWLLREGGLTVFAEQAELLSGVWFEGCHRGTLLPQLEVFILKGGIFGSKSNELKLLRTKSDSLAAVVLCRIFKPYGQIIFQYPIVKKYPVLLPVFWIRRWITLLLKKGKVRSAVRELKLNQNLDRESISVTKQLFEKLELH